MFKKIEKLKQKGKKIGFTCSTFDLLHAGHIAMLSEAKAHCDFLIVGLLSDPTISRPDSKSKPVQSIYERYIQLQAVKYVGMIIPFDTEEDICNIVKMIEPDIRFVGEEYQGTKHTGWNISPIMYNKRKHEYSTTELKQRIINNLKK